MGCSEIQGGHLEAMGGRSMWDAYSASLDASPKTIATYRHALAQWSSWLESQGMGPLDATRETVISFKRHMAETHSAATTNAYLCAVRSLYAWTESQGIHPNVAAGVRGVRAKAHSSKDSLSVEQARRLVAERHSDTNEVKALRDRAIINLMARRGLRCIEVSRADVGDLRHEGGKAVLYVQGKGHATADDFIVLGEDCAEPIRAYLRARGRASDDAPLFAATGNRNGGGRMSTRSISRIVKDALREQGIDDPRITAHSLRHTAVTLSLAGGASIQEAQSMARHSSIAVTERYAHNLRKLDAGAERAVDALLDGEHTPNTEASTTEHTGEHTANTAPPAETREANTCRAHSATFVVFAGGLDRTHAEHTPEVAHA